MAMKSAGLKALRWLVWLFLFWLVVRGIASFFPSDTAVAKATANPRDETTVEPPGLHAFPAMFAREYLTWDAGSPQDHPSRLAPYLGRALRPPTLGTDRPGISQQVRETWVQRISRVSETRWLVTVAARVALVDETRKEAKPGVQVSPEKLLYVAVPIAQTPDGGWVVYDYPTLLPPPPGGQFSEPLHYGKEVPDEGGQVRTLLTRFFPAYFTGSTADLAYYLTPEARIQSFQSPWSFDSVTEVILSQTEGGLYALAQVVLVDPATGARYTNRYTLGLVQREGRWYIQNILQKGE